MTKIEKPFTETTTATVESSYVTPEELARFVHAVSNAVYAEGVKAYPSCAINWNRIEHRGGAKYAKLVSVRERCSGASAYCFIDLSNGNILKPAGWKGPSTKHARGNIRVGDASNWWAGALNVYGTAYLR